MIPGIKPMPKDYSHYKEILSTFTVKKPMNEDGWGSFIALSLPKGENKKETSSTVIQCWFKEAEGSSCKSLKRAIEADLRNNGHFIYPHLVEDVLVFFTLLRNSSGAVGYELIQEIIGSISEHDVQMWKLIPFSIKLKKFKSITGWEFGSLDHEKLKYNTEIKGNSDFYEKWGDYIRKRGLDYAIISNPITVKIINIFSFRNRIKGQYLSQVIECVDIIFDHLFEQVKLVIHKEFEDANNILAAAGKNAVDLYSLNKIPISFNIYILRSRLNGNHNWIQGREPVLNINGIQPGDDKLLEEHAFIDEYKLNDDCPSEILHAAKALSKCMGKARELLVDNRTDEAFLHHMIGIEITLIKRQEGIGKAVSRRLAALTHRKANKDFCSQEKHITELYQRRSDYVHKGRIKSTLKGEVQWEVNQRSLDEASRLSLHLLMWLLRVNRENSWNHAGAMEELLKRLDLMASAHDAKMPPDEKSYQEILL